MAECLQPLTMFNPHYKKFPWKLSIAKLMPHDLYINVPCGKCVHCRRRLASDWRIRVYNELSYGYKQNKYYRADFITLTISDEFYAEFREKPERALHLFRERFRKKFGHALRHFFVTELGDKSARLHFHGIIINYPFDIAPEDFKRRLNPPSIREKINPLTGKKYGKYGAFVNNNGKIKDYVEELKSVWQYGHVWVDTVRSETVNYIVKYITKLPDVQTREEFADDEFVQNWKPRVFTSPGLGKAYCDDIVKRNFHNQTKEGIWYVECEKSGGQPYKAPLPRYYVLKLFSEAKRRFLSKARWLNPPPFVKYLNKIRYTDEFSYKSQLYAIYADSIKRGTTKMREYYRLKLVPMDLIFRWLSSALNHSKEYYDATYNTLLITSNIC